MLALILGTRPEMIKFAPIIRILRKRKVAHTIIHTGQHYSYEMDRVFFEELNLPQPDYNLRAGSGTHATQTARIIESLEPVLVSLHPDAVVVLGDTNTTLSGALTSVKLHIPVVHVEAGLRSFDRRMPEEINRVLTDHASDLLFPPTQVSRKNLLHEGIPAEKIHVTGNTIVDAVNQNIKLAKDVPLPRDIPHKEYGVLTLHREENVDSPEILKSILRGVGLVSKMSGLEIIYPIHPRTKKRLHEGCIPLPEGIIPIDPLGYLEFLSLEMHASLILTDSGGVQEEACTLGVPCVTLRTTTERPETVDVGANILAGVDDPSMIVKCAKVMLARKRKWRNPLGDGKAGEKIVKTITSMYERKGAG